MPSTWLLSRSKDASVEMVNRYQGAGDGAIWEALASINRKLVEINAQIKELNDFVYEQWHGEESGHKR